jgi:hypothetical protein
MSNSSTNRLDPPRPRPRPPPVVKPSRSACPMSPMPGPLSTKISPIPLRQAVDVDLAAAAVFDGVAGQLAGRRHQLGLVHQRQRDRHRPFAHLLAQADYVFIRTQAQRDAVCAHLAMKLQQAGLERDRGVWSIAHHW